MKQTNPANNPSEDTEIAKAASGPRKNTPAERKPTVLRDSGGRFRPGSFGNPHGRPAGSRNRLTLQMEELLGARAEALWKKNIEMALEGNVLAMRLCLERLLPVRREREMALDLPLGTSTNRLSKAFESVTAALTQGELTPTETNSAAALIETARRAFETEELARRVEELEERIGKSEESGSRGRFR